MDPKVFQKYVNEKLKLKVGINPLWIDNDIAITDEDKANKLHMFFASFFKRKHLDNVPKFEPSSMSNSIILADMCFTAEAVMGQLKNLNPNRVFEPDVYPTSVFKELHGELAVPLCILFNKSTEQANVPLDWKEA